MTRATAADFLARVIADPADDTPRLVYADWLEEHGGAEGGLRAEFIRAQCRLASCKVCDGSGKNAVSPCACSLLSRRERVLLCHNFDRWHNLPGDPHGRVWDMQNFDDGDPEPEAQWRALFRRGFVAEVALPCSAWLTHREGLLASAPLERVTLTHAAAGRMRNVDGTLVCPVHAAPRGNLSFALDVHGGDLWYTLGPDGEHDVFLVRAEPTPHENPQAAYLLTFEDAFRAYWTAQYSGVGNAGRNTLFGHPVIHDEPRGTIDVPDAPAAATGRRRNSRRPDWLTMQGRGRGRRR